jgi:uncharacterized membrane protein YccC
MAIAKDDDRNSVNLSLNFKESLKTALAMTIAIGIALAMNWEKAYWAGFAVAFCSLATIGQSLEKASMRMAGTVVAVAVALLVIALFGQQRWGFIIFLSLYGAVCSYMMSGSANAYFWQVCWFVVLVVCVGGGANSVNAFQTSMLRLQETGLGILVYSLVALFVWPQRSGPRLIKATVDLVALQRQLLRACLATVENNDTATDLSKLATQERKLKVSFDQLLQAARVDSSEVAELRPQWRGLQQQLTRFSLSITRWREASSDLKNLDMQSLLPDLAAFGAELDARQEQIGLMLAGARPERQLQALALPLNAAALDALSPLQRAAVAVSRSHLLDIERITRAQFDILSDIRGFRPQRATLPEVREESSGFFVPDPDRLAGVVRLVLMIWLSFLAGIYISDLPGGFQMLIMTASVGMVLANTPQLRISVIYLPAVWGIAFAAALYVFVMPALSSYLSLGTIIFVVTFAICYLFAAPPPALGRVVGLSMFLVLSGFTNQPSYNFLSISATSLVLVGVFLIMNIAWYFPFNLFPERVFLRQLRRFFRSADYLITTLPSHPRSLGRLARWQHAFHCQEINLLPAKLASWAPLINPGVVAGASPDNIQALVATVQSLSIQLQHIIAQRSATDPEISEHRLPPEFNLWQRSIQAGLRRLATEQDIATVSRELRVELEDTGKELTAKVGSAFAQRRQQFDQLQLESYYRMLDTCRGTSMALLDCSRIMAGIDWSSWRQERFA